MAVELHMDGRIERGRMAEFLGVLPRWLAYRRGKGWPEPDVLVGLTGAMNSVRLIFRYDDLSDVDRENRASSQDRAYARLASRLPFEGVLVSQLLRPAAPPARAPRRRR